MTASFEGLLEDAADACADKDYDAALAYLREFELALNHRRVPKELEEQYKGVWVDVVAGRSAAGLSENPVPKEQLLPVQ